MPAADSAALLVARFLWAHNYTQSYQAFIDEARLPKDAGDASTTLLTLERLLEEKRLYDQSVSFEKLNLADEPQQGWAPNAPREAAEIQVLPSRANILSVLKHKQGEQDLLFVSTSDRRIHVIALPQKTLQTSWTHIQDSPVLSQVVLGKYHISASMSGSIVIVEIETGVVIETRNDHAKYIVALATCSHDGQYYIASAGWDNRVNIYRIMGSATDTDFNFGAPFAQITLQTKPEAIAMSTHPDTKRPVLVVSRTDSSHLYFYAVDKEAALLGRQNLAPHSNAWVAFTPSSIAVSPLDSSIIAVATNSTPHMKLIVAKLLFPIADNDSTPVTHTAREEALLQQAVADKEHEAIKLHCNTMSAQTPYSSPLVVWRPDGQGVWVNGDDGVIRGMDVLTGKIVSQLQVHEPGTKVRTLYAVKGTGKKEELFSGGFDHKLILWTATDI